MVRTTLLVVFCLCTMSAQDLTQSVYLETILPVLNKHKGEHHLVNVLRMAELAEQVRR